MTTLDDITTGEAPEAPAPQSPLDLAYQSLMQAGDGLQERFTAVYPEGSSGSFTQGDIRLLVDYAAASAAFALAVEVSDLRRTYLSLEVGKINTSSQPPQQPALWRPGLPV